MLELNLEHFTKEHNFNLDAETLFTDYKAATDDTLLPWTLGSAKIDYMENTPQASPPSPDCFMAPSSPDGTKNL
jgi:hypothetical protein